MFPEFREVIRSRNPVGLDSRPYERHRMKLTKFTNLLVLGIVLTVAVVGCKKKPYGVTPLPGSRPGAITGPGPGEPVGPGVGSTNAEPTGIPLPPAGSHDGWIEDASIFKSDTVYFDFDSSVVKASEKPRISAVADYLKGHSAQAVRVEGHCDERGTEEYNRALGERRALAIREELVRLGIDPTRLDTISFGKDRPAEPGHDDAAWKKNRRGEFILLSPPNK